jgi:hypothetical protein
MTAVLAAEVSALLERREAALAERRKRLETAIEAHEVSRGPSFLTALPLLPFLAPSLPHFLHFFLPSFPIRTLPMFSVNWTTSLNPFRYLP